LTVLDRLRIALSNLERIPAHKLPSPPHQKRRASVAIIIRIRPFSKNNCHYNEEKNINNNDEELSSFKNNIRSIDDFWTLPWVNDGIPEILYIQRALREGDRWSGQMAFPGGKQDPEDADDLDTAERETFEEVGFDLGNNELFMNVGALDDLEVTTTFGKTLLMVLCPFVFIQLTRESPKIEISGSEVASTHWIPISVFFDPKLSQKFNPISIDLSPRLAPQSWILQNILKTLIGRMHFHCIDLPQSNLTTTETTQSLEMSSEKLPEKSSDEFHNTTLRLWGLTLQMTSDLMDMMYRLDEEPPRRLDASRPKFDYWDDKMGEWLE
ncbi:11255_t:CDS:2, partial [Diversispora eburnea]